MSMKTPVKIRLDSRTREALRGIGRKGETYDDVLRRIIKYWVLEEELHEGADRILELLGEEEG